MKTIVRFLILILLPSLCFSQNYYVALNGFDTNPGTDSLPWRTVLKACTTVTAGSTVFIKAGTYDESNNGNGINVLVQGNTANLITIRNFNNDNVFITRTDNSTIKKLFIIQNKSFLRFIGLKITGISLNQWGAGFSIEGTSNNIEISRCEFYNLIGPGAAIMSEEPFGYRNNLLISENNIHDCNFGSFGAALLLFKGYGQNLIIKKNHIYNIPSSGTFKAIMFEGRDYNLSFSNSVIDSNIINNCSVNNGEAISLSGNIEYINISNNQVYNINNIGIDAKGGYGDCPNPSLDYSRYIRIFDNIVYNCRDIAGNSTGIYLDGARNCTIERNIVYKCSQGIRIDCETLGVANYDTIRSNNVYDCDRTGILVGRYDNDPNRFVTNCIVLNNTIFKNLDTSTTIYDADFGCSKSSNCIFKNNIIYKGVRQNDNERRLIAVQTGSSNNVFDYNFYWFPLNSNAVTIYYMGTVYNNFSSYVSATGQDVHSIFLNPQLVDTNISSLNLHLRNNSPALNVGDINFIPVINEKDIDKESRVYNNRVDCGSDENQPFNSITPINNLIPNSFSLSQNYPNPFNPNTKIQFSIPVGDAYMRPVKLIIFDILGREITTLVNKNLQPGTYEVDWDGSNFASGVYFYTLQTDPELSSGFTETKKMVLIK